MTGDTGSTPAALTDLSIPVPADHLQKWVANTYMIRACELVLARTVDPRPGSALAQVDTIYHWEKVSVWSRAYLRAAAENLGLWADYVAPFSFAPGMSRMVRVRPYLLLGRSGLEAATHAVWLFDGDTNTYEECVQRHLRLMHRDFRYHRQALDAHGEETSLIDQRIADLEQRAATLPFSTAPRNQPPGYEKLVRHAAKVTGNDENFWAYLWNAASGAGHGQNWFGLEAYNLLHRIEYEPDHYRTLSIPDPMFVTELIGAASLALQWGTLRWLMYGGHDPELLSRATAETFAKMPKKERHSDTEPEESPE
ncbi:hypothetical protein [Nocardia cyriacigeorgica]|uniref:Uncharacterized protein n=1 Tax=Nocardia cyriacigeorgica TaxID=135487 RepID=A0A5R8NEF2_9NOCA|nr:hypothetical protein [Nocardia cyriacigeorgica]TLF74039.1 hypothetical protein FEK34_25290 [Nocardia cyriacigeorgica]